MVSAPVPPKTTSLPLHVIVSSPPCRGWSSRRDAERDQAVVAEHGVVSIPDRDPVHAGPAEDDIVPVAGLNGVVPDHRRIERRRRHTEDHGTVVAEDGVSFVADRDAVAGSAAEHNVVAVAGHDRVHVAHTRIDRLRRNTERDQAVVAEHRVVSIADVMPSTPGPPNTRSSPLRPHRVVPETVGSSVVADTPKSRNRRRRRPSAPSPTVMPSPAAPPNTKSLPSPATIVSTSPTPGSIVVAETPKCTRPSSPNTVSFPSPTVIPSTPGPAEHEIVPVAAADRVVPDDRRIERRRRNAERDGAVVAEDRVRSAADGDAVAGSAAEHEVVAVTEPRSCPRRPHPDRSSSPRRRTSPGRRRRTPCRCRCRA